MPTQPPLDLEEFRSTMRAAGIEEIIEPMLDLFTTEAAKGMDLIRSALAAGDLHSLSRAAHSLKSSAGNVCARALAGVMKELEAAAAQGDRAAAERLVNVAETEHAAVQRCLAERKKSG